MIDFFASERHYIDHIAPVWLGLPKSARGRFLTKSDDLVIYAASKGVSAIVDNPTDNLTLVSSYGDYKKTQGPVVFMEHGIGHSYSNNHPSYAGGEGKDRAILFLCQHELTASKNRATYPNAKIAVIGTPKLDTLTPRPAIGRTVAISFHWDCKVSPESRSALPHFRNVIPHLARAKDIELIGHAHPKVSFNLSMQRYYRSVGVEYVHNFEEVLDRADLYVIDNSSSAYEFAALGRNVLHLNAPWYRRDVSHGIRFWDYLPGPMVDYPKQVLPLIRKMLDNPELYDPQREAVVSQLYPHRGKATSLAVKAIKEVLS